MTSLCSTQPVQVVLAALLASLAGDFTCLSSRALKRKMEKNNHFPLEVCHEKLVKCWIACLANGKYSVTSNSNKQQQWLLVLTECRHCPKLFDSRLTLFSISITFRSHLTDEETEVWRGEATYPRLQSCLVSDPKAHTTPPQSHVQIQAAPHVLFP